VISALDVLAAVFKEELELVEGVSAEEEEEEAAASLFIFSSCFSSESAFHGVANFAGSGRL